MNIHGRHAGSWMVLYPGIQTYKFYEVVENDILSMCLASASDGVL